MKTQKIIVYLITLLILITFNYGLACAEEENISIGKIILVENNVTITKEDGTQLAAQAQLPLFAGDRIETGEKGSVQFSINENIFKLGSASDMAIDEFAEIAHESENQPVLQLIVGFLESIIKQKNDSIQPAIHTPTAVAGIRGTVFDTVVSLDGTTVIAVDEGRVEVEWEKSTAIIETGKMAEVNEDAQELKHTQAVPKKHRNWKGWRIKKEKDIVKKFPSMLNRYQKRFEKWTDNYNADIAGLNSAKKQLADTIEKIKLAEKDGDQKALQFYNTQLQEQSKALKKAIKKSRRHFNKSKTISKHMKKLKKHAHKNKHRFDKKTLALLDSHFDFVKQREKHLKKHSRNLIKELKKTVKDSKKFRKKWRKNKHMKKAEKKEKKHRKRDHDKHDKHQKHEKEED